MSYVIGIDTGGTYTDSVLLDVSKKGVDSVLKKAKSFTTHANLEIGIENSFKTLNLSDLEINEIEKVVLSTTLATNAIVENKIHKVGLILIGGVPKGRLATDYIVAIQGQVNIKGRVNTNLNRNEVVAAIDKLSCEVDAIAISGVASVRNPVLEQEVKAIVEERCDLPVMCGHEFVNDLGFLERTNTVVMNAGLIPIINKFIASIKNVLNKYNVSAPIFVVRGDGSLASLDFVGIKPVDTVLSGPAASMIGTVHLTGIDNAVIADMGGTTTDIGIIKGKKVDLSDDGAWIGGWNLRIKSARLNTVGLGGDSRISMIKGDIKVGPERILPLCRGGEEDITPTDLLHYTEEYVCWERDAVINKINNRMQHLNMSPDVGVKKFEKTVLKKIYIESVLPYEYLKFPVCAIGAPAKTWFKKTEQEYKFNLIVPENYEVANAVGAATAGIQENAVATIRKGEEGFGFLIHAENGRYAFRNKKEAIIEAIEITKKIAEDLILQQGLGLGEIEIECIESYLRGDDLVHEKLYIEDIEKGIFERKEGSFVESVIKVSVSGKIFN